MIPLVIPLPGSVHSADTELHVSPAPCRIWRFEEEYVLGTRLEVLVNSRSEALASECAAVARAEIDRLDGIFNHRSDDSELATLNRSRRARVTPELFSVVQASELWRAVTRGAFDGRMAELLRLWHVRDEPDSDAVASALRRLHSSHIALFPADSRIELSAGVVLSLDAVAKGFVVDAALNAARRAVPAIEGLAIAIGGDLRCWGVEGSERGWRVGIADATLPVMNAPSVESVVLHNAAIATSGRGPRDCVGGQLRSSTISPFSGQPVREVVAASVVASHAMDADALATACMVMSTRDSLAMLERIEGAAARITDARGHVHTSEGWAPLRLAAAAPEEHIAPRAQKRSVPAVDMWPAEWVLSIDYTAPPRQARRNVDFRSPYMAMWVTDEQNRPVRTVLMVGRELDWQRDNFVWWGINRARTKELVSLRSLPTSVSGRYPVYWAGADDDAKPVATGKYILHLETSQERGKHNYRSVPLELGRKSFRQHLPQLEGSGGIEIYYGHPSERYDYP